MGDNSETQVTRIGSLVPISPPGDECIVEIYGPNLGKKYSLETTILVGRGSECDVVLSGDSVSRRHARLERVPEGVRVRDLDSTNGTFVNDGRITETTLMDGDHLKVGSSIFKYLAGGNVERAYHEEIYQMTIMDGLTAVYNRRYLQEFLEREVARAKRHERPLSVVMFDLDHFKRVNDQYGHLVGDNVLREFSDIVKQCVRREEVFGRYGGEEFCAVLPETRVDGAVALAERIRTVVAQRRFHYAGVEVPVTVSAGVAQLGTDMAGWSELVERADKKLYDAKSNGRNRVAR